MNALRKVGNFFAPKAQKSEDGRDKWGSRTSFVLAAMGGAVGLGNLLRFPSIAYNNNGIQFFLPYFIAIIFIGIPILILEISIGQAYRGGCIIAYDHISPRTKGVGLAVIFNGYAVALYYIPILAYVMNYFRNSFTSPLPWAGRGEEFYYGDVVRNVAPIGGAFNDDGSVASYYSYPGIAFNPETVGWCAFTWFVVWMCMFKGVGMTGRVVYFTMGIPIVMIIILLGRGVSLPNAVDGVRMYLGVWHGDKLANQKIWQEATGHVFFSIGLGFGYFTSYGSYNSQFSNAVQDALIICCSNSLIEITAGFAVFGVLGFLGVGEGEMTLSTFTVGFLTYPLAIVEMPGANFWAAIFFITLQVLGFSSGFALMESIITMVMDTDWAKKVPGKRPTIATIAVIISFLLSLPYCTEFGFYMIDAFDMFINYLSLFFVVWFEAVSVTVVYRYKDVINQVGLPAFLVYNFGYFGGQIFGIGLGHGVSPGAGAGLGFGLYILGAVAAVFLAKTPDTLAPRFWGNNNFTNRFWWLGFYSGNQLTRDLNITIASGNNWSIPMFWAPTLRYVSAPILAIVFSFAYQRFYEPANELRNNPIYILAFGVAHLTMLMIVVVFIVPRSLDTFVPAIHKAHRKQVVIPGVMMEPVHNAEGDVEVHPHNEYGYGQNDGYDGGYPDNHGSDSREREVKEEKKFAVAR